MQVYAGKCHKTMVVRNKGMASPPPLNISTLAPDIIAATNPKGRNPTFWYTVPRKDAVKYCKDYYSAENKMERMLEVRPTSTPETTSMVYMTASNKACRSYKTIKPSLVIQQSGILVGRPYDFIINCPPNNDVCYVYKLERQFVSTVPLDADSSPQGMQSSLLPQGRKLQCDSDGTFCAIDEKRCCSGKCELNEYGLGRCVQTCFPGESTVELADGSLIQLSSLRLHDKIKVIDASGSVKVEPALTWLHRNPSEFATYLRISAVDPKTNATAHLRISPNHFLQTSKATEVPSFMSSEMAPAGDVEVGSWVWIKSGSTMTPATVTAVAPEHLQGVYSLMTDSGTVIVDGVAASNHADIVLRDGSMLCESFVARKNIPKLHHAFLAPIRWASKVVGPKAMESLASKSNEGSLTVAFGTGVQNAIYWAKGV
jgi:hypothetical protein